MLIMLINVNTVNNTEEVIILDFVCKLNKYVRGNGVIFFRNFESILKTYRCTICTIIKIKLR